MFKQEQNNHDDLSRKCQPLHFYIMLEKNCPKDNPGNPIEILNKFQNNFVCAELNPLFK